MRSTERFYQPGLRPLRDLWFPPSLGDDGNVGDRVLYPSTATLHKRSPTTLLRAVSGRRARRRRIMTVANAIDMAGISAASAVAGGQVGARQSM